MKFSIITPTYKKADLLKRAVESLQSQTYSDWEMIIINDSPKEESYKNFEQNINDARIRYLKNEKNEGVNFSRNKGLDSVSIHSDWIIFLDDDDYLAPDALDTFFNLIRRNSDIHWFITNRALKNGQPLTTFPKTDTFYSYAWSYLILKRCKGDATHCIETKKINEIRFSKNVKQAEEWFFYYQLGLKNKFYYHDHNSTITEGYDAATGLNFRKRTREGELTNISKIIYEAGKIGIIYRSTFLIYVLLRTIKSLIKP